MGGLQRLSTSDLVTWEPGVKVMSLVWVDKPDKSRLCVRGFQRKLYDSDALYTPTPFPASVSLLLVVPQTENLRARRFDVCRAFLHTP